VIVSIGCGMILNSLHKFLFDKLLRGNFNSLFSNIKFHTNLDKVLDNLRKHAINKLSNEKKILKINDNAIKQSDFFLYESIGGIVHTDTREYVNDARVIGYIALLFQIPLITELFFRMNIPNTIEHNFFPFSILIVLSYIIGYENIKYIYKLRAIRIYTNYLMDEQLSKSAIVLVNDIPNKTHENKGVNG
jgi:hypothetical protein